jgi:hypothetical protein
MQMKAKTRHVFRENNVTEYLLLQKGLQAFTEDDINSVTKEDLEGYYQDVMEKENNFRDTVEILPDLIHSCIISLVTEDSSEESGNEHNVSSSPDDMQSASKIVNFKMNMGWT